MCLTNKYIIETSLRRNGKFYINSTKGSELNYFKRFKYCSGNIIGVLASSVGLTPTYFEKVPISSRSNF